MAGRPRMLVEVDQRLCKSCGICIEFCRQGVLEAQGPLQKAAVVHPERCTGCGLCELYCPDWAINLEEGGSGGE